MTKGVRSLIALCAAHSIRGGLVWMSVWLAVTTCQGQSAPPPESSTDSEASLEFGMAKRIPWTESRLQGFPDPPPPFELERVYPQIVIPKLIALKGIPDTPYLLAVDHETEWGGPSRVVQFRDAPDVAESTPFLERPEVIYGLAFHPNFAQNRWVYVGCNGRSEELDAIATRIIRFTVVGDGPFECDPDSAQVVIEWKSNGHNGGDVAFDGHGMLFVSTGDGTSDSDRDRNGQRLTTLAGKILRIDVDQTQAGRNYGIPADNPFLDQEGVRPEIWCYGMRNPWRITYDAESQQLWAGNNGQDLWESVYLIEKGANYGWSINESNHPFHTNQDHGPVPISPATAEHHHSEARSLTGGHVYRGKRFPELLGAYIYGDYSTGNLWAIRHDGTDVVFQEHIARSGAQISGFGLDKRGELLIADHEGGIYALQRNTSQQTASFPTRLSETGLFQNTASEQPLAGLIPYSVNAPLWSDGAHKRRWMAIPGDKTITYHPTGSWEFPEGTVFVKSFAFPFNADGDLRRVETRLLVNQQGEWFGYSYRWNAAQTEAELVQGEGQDEVLDWVNEYGNQASVAWRYPSRSECMVCHTRAAKYVLGLSTEQMHKAHNYGKMDEQRIAPQIESLQHIGLFGSDPPAVEPTRPRLVNPHDPSHALEQRARSYLHANCAPCHVVSGGGNSKIVLDFFHQLGKANLLDEEPVHGDLGLSSPEEREQGVFRLIKPGDPGKSILLSRVARRGNGQMPPLATHRVDTQAVALLHDWIASLDPGESQ